MLITTSQIGGLFFYPTSLDIKCGYSKIYLNMTTTFSELAGRVVEISTVPTNPSVGQEFFDTDTNYWMRYDGGTWRGIEMTSTTTSTSTTSTSSSTSSSTSISTSSSTTSTSTSTTSTSTSTTSTSSSTTSTSSSTSTTV